MRWQLKKERGKKGGDGSGMRLFYALIVPLVIAAFASLLSLLKDVYFKDTTNGQLVLESVYTDQLDKKYDDQTFGGNTLDEYTLKEAETKKGISLQDEEKEQQKLELNYAQITKSLEDKYRDKLCYATWYSQLAMGSSAFSEQVKWLIANDKLESVSRVYVDGVFSEYKYTPIQADSLHENNLGVLAYFIRKVFEDTPPSLYITQDGNKCPGFLFFELYSQGPPPKGSIKDLALNVIVRNTGGKDITITGYKTKVLFIGGGEAGSGGYVLEPIDKDPIEFQVSTFSPISKKLDKPIGLEATKTMLLRMAPRYKTGYFGDGPIFFMYQLELLYFDGSEEQSVLIGNFMEMTQSSCQYEWGGPEGECIKIIANLQNMEK